MAIYRPAEEIQQLAKELEALKHCPFCLREKVEIRSQSCGGIATMYFAKCLVCGTEGPDSNPTELSAIRAWNNRKEKRDE